MTQAMQIIHMSITPSYRLRLDDGGYVYMSWHNWYGPAFYHDKLERRDYEDWYENPSVCRALDWFLARGKRT
ncbi:hypothetical protein [Erwinia aphidicola]|uniref:hypothetical protein n=1 Tax=Erwinia aphidicola TaxID=68334 RepID=UPI0030CD8A3B